MRRRHRGHRRREGRGCRRRRLVCGGLAPSGEDAGAAPGQDWEAGVATVLAAVCLLVLVVVTGVAAQLGAVVLARHQAEVAADLAALAAAGKALGGADRSCAAAADLARANGAELVSCEQVSLTVRVQVRCRVRAGPLVGTATGRARAGPVDPGLRAANG